MRAHDIIIKPILTEKSYAGIANKVYTFKVVKDANAAMAYLLECHKDFVTKSVKPL